MANKLPIVIVTGCLGSGKTTVLNYILDHIDNSRTPVIVNEYGKAGLDHHLLRQSEERISLINSGCVCCNSRDDLEDELNELLNEHERSETGYERVVIETTGLADPAPIVYTILNNPVLQHHFEVESIITTVDAKNAMLQFENSPEIVKQLSVADKIVITKTDLVSEEEIEAVEAQIRQLNPAADLFYADNGVVDLAILETSSEYSLADIKPESIHLTTGAASAISSISFEFAKPLDWTAFSLWLSLLLHTHGENVMRVKGILDVGETGPVNLNGVQHVIHPPSHLDEWPEDVDQSFMVFIVKNIEPEKIMKSLEVFQHYIGSDVSLMEYQEAI